MKHKGYTGSVMYDAEDNILHGKVVGMGSTTISYQGSSLDELEKDFRAGVDHYLQICSTRRVAPVKPFSGKMLVRVSSELHEKAMTAAMARGLSLNRYLAIVLSEAIRSSKGQHRS
jgi:predicted HicB family RNase H-like nuclease